MIRVLSEKRPLNHFWKHAVFHPTDAIEDAWGKKLLERFSRDGALKTIRLYAMLEDIVYEGEEGELQYDFRLNDLRLDTLLTLGFEPMISYAFMPPVIASGGQSSISVSYNATRYKGKTLNTTNPRSLALWEEVCYRYTEHIVERYGLERVSSWHLHCLNEPDLKSFYLSHLPSSREDPEALKARAEGYLDLYEAFTRALIRVSPQLCMGGPALCSNRDFLRLFLEGVKKREIRIDYLTFHDYGTSVAGLNSGSNPFRAESIREKMESYLAVVKEYGFDDREIVCDEWGAASRGFANVEEAPAFIFRETEQFSAYFVRMLCDLISCDNPLTKTMMLLCLSGQHEMKTDFSGFRGFFTLHHFAKPIYNAFVLAGRLGTERLLVENTEENLFLLPTKRENGDLALLMCYCDEYFSERPSPRDVTLFLPSSVKGKRVTLWAVDKEHCAPYRRFEEMGSPNVLTEEAILALRKEGTLKPVSSFVSCEDALPPIPVLANGTYLITVEGT